MTLELNNGMIDIYNNTSGAAGVGTLVAADPLSSTSQININGGDYATNSLTIDFNNGNMIPAGGLYFDGTAYGYFGNTTTGPVGIPSLTLQGELPSGPWNGETVRPLSPTSGFITLGGTTNINYADFASPALSTTPAITDVTPATNVSYIALGSNLDLITLGEGPILDLNSLNQFVGTDLPILPGGVTAIQSTQYFSSGPAMPATAPLFTPVNFVNKTNVTIADADGNDTLIVNFNNGDPLTDPGLTTNGQPGLSFNGGTGYNTINITGTAANSTYTLGAAAFSDATLGGTLNVLHEQNFIINAGPNTNNFLVGAWAYNATLNGGGGNDALMLSTSTHMGVSTNSAGEDLVGDGNGMLLTLNGIGETVLQGLGGTVYYTVNAWNTGTLWLNGGTGSNIYNISDASTEDLDTILQQVNINASGTSNVIAVYDQKNIVFPFVDYTLTSTSITSKPQVIVSLPSRLFPGVQVASGTITGETIFGSDNGSTYNVAPSRNTAYNINGYYNGTTTLTPNVLNFIANYNSGTLFSTTGSSFTQNSYNSGLFLYPQAIGRRRARMTSS